MYDIIIIGAGVIGCSAARELSRYKLNICVIDKAGDIGEGTSKANSAIIHAGFDAKPGTLKGKLNAKGNKMFDTLSKELDFPFKRIGALVLCFDKKDMSKLETLKAQGEENGVEGLKILSSGEVLELEKNISDKVQAALFAPTSGIVCPYEMNIALAENANLNGVEFKFNDKVIQISKESEVFKVETNEGVLEAKCIVNAAGVYADDINNMISQNKIHIVPRKGEYCLFDKVVGDTVSKTIFQLPTERGKGVLVTPTVDGNLLVGPNAMDIDEKDDVSTSKQGLDEILSKAKESIKEIPMRQIITSFTGLRAHDTNEDFIVEEAKDVSGFINAAGIESPGLSSAPAIGEMIKELVLNKFNAEKKAEFNPIRKGIPKFRKMSNEERKSLIKKRPDYGKIICRCEMVTEGEIVDSIKRPLGAKNFDGVKRRTRAGMGRCQAGFCTPKIVDILSRELHLPKDEITKFGGNSKMLKGKNKEEF